MNNKDLLEYYLYMLGGLVVGLLTALLIIYLVELVSKY